ncbi:aldehyde dehydrogenase family protein [Vibrio sp. SCSIO 43137]|uniref:aldehyde dehydrogenase family protein n=1 Tax=Vibrio sp. SCSIO 43137 TaxID=3021011 RepID=UPI0023077C02|nr:aldehyde dehydrogenase family protein [Vibrio sp. SCSIO 43137]WCE31874.1 aldehyde dehydrogenase family protein [Vibrio sp. SCSIO 43137]
MNKPQLTINGTSVLGEMPSLKVLNPANESVVFEAPSASPAQLDAAVESARSAFKSWSTLTQSERDSYIEKIADTIEENAQQLAGIIVKEQGKPLALAHMEVGGAVAWTRHSTSIEIPVEVYQDSPEKRIEGRRKPVGVVGSITPWNWPLMIAIWHIIPALRMGNTVINKPSELTPVNTLVLGELLQSVLPAGVFNVVSGDGELGRAISEHKGIDKVVFTGSTQTGQKIMQSAAGNLKKLTLELGGNDAGIVLPGADLTAIAEGLFNTAFINMGQTCAALKRLYVHQSQHDELCNLLADIAQNHVVKDGMDPSSTFGPVQNSRQLEKVMTLVEQAKQSGATIYSGGEKSSQQGYFYPPTIIGNCKNGMSVVDEEQFGPVLPLIPYDSVEQAIEMANDSQVGLGGSVWGDTEKAGELASHLECGTVWINGHAEVLPHAPFGGCKMSGFGVEFGLEGLLENSLLQVVNINK